MPDKDTLTPLVQPKAADSWPELVGSLVPKYGDPSWYFSFVILAVVACVALVKFIDVKFGKDRRDAPAPQSAAIPPAPTLGGLPLPPQPAREGEHGSCGDHARRLGSLEGEIGQLYETLNTRLLDTERTMRTALEAGLRADREETDRRLRGLRTDLKEDMDRLEERVVDTVSEKLNSFQTALLGQIQTMFREGQDGLRLRGQDSRSSRVDSRVDSATDDSRGE